MTLLRDGGALIATSVGRLRRAESRRRAQLVATAWLLLLRFVLPASRCIHFGVTGKVVGKSQLAITTLVVNGASGYSLV